MVVEKNDPITECFFDNRYIGRIDLFLFCGRDILFHLDVADRAREDTASSRQAVLPAGFRFEGPTVKGALWAGLSTGRVAANARIEIDRSLVCDTAF